MSHLTLTKSRTSRISRPQTKSPIKKPSFDLKTRSLNPPPTAPSSDRSSAATPKLEVTQLHLPADPELLISDVLAGMKYLSEIQFPPFPDRGLGRDRIAELYNARKAIPNVVMLSQLHSVFNTHTLIERDLSTLISSGIIRKIILRGSVESGKGGEVTGLGGDIGLILSSSFQERLSSHGSQFETFAKWVEGLGRGTVAISHKALVEQGVEDEEIKKLIEMGFLIIDYSMGEEGYTICIPGAGAFVRNLRGGRKELLKALKRQKYKEMLEKNLMAKKMRESILSYSFHLHELMGSGRVEVFMTPAGRGLKITSKGLAEVK